MTIFAQVKNDSVINLVVAEQDWIDTLPFEENVVAEEQIPFEENIVTEEKIHFEENIVK